MVKDKNIKVGSLVVVMGSLYTEIKRIEGDKYYFEDESGKEWHENIHAIELQEDHVPEQTNFCATEESLKNQPESFTTTSGGEPVTISLKKEQPEEESTQAILEKVLSNPVVREQAVINATYIQSKLKNWFTFDQLITKTNLKDHQPAQDLMDLLCLFGLAYRKTNEHNIIKYKITLSKEDKKKLLEEEIQETLQKVEYLYQQLNKLK